MARPMSKVLAPSNTGYKWQRLIAKAKWKPIPPYDGDFIEVTGTPLVLLSYKSQLNKSDGKAPTNYTRMISKIVPGGGVDANNGRYRYKSDTSITVGVIEGPQGCNTALAKVSSPDWMRDQAIMDAIAEMQGISANIFEDLAQLRQTGNMVVEIFTTICALYRFARQGSWSRLRRALSQEGVNIPRHIANGWLMYFYGIKPLISTIEALCASDKPKYKVMTVRKRKEMAVEPRSYTDAGWWVDFDGEAKIQVQCQLSAGIRLRGDLAYFQNLGLTSSALTDAVVTAWAIVPYSFVLDWILPVETFLRTRSWAPFLEYQGGFVGTRHYVNSRFVDLWPWSGSFPYGGVLPNGSLQVRFYKRETYPYFVPPSALSFDLRLSSTQIASAVALAIK